MKKWVLVEKYGDELGVTTADSGGPVDEQEQQKVYTWRGSTVWSVEKAEQSQARSRREEAPVAKGYGLS